MKRLILCAAIASGAATSAHAQLVPNIFDRTSGANTYYVNGIGEHLDDANWIGPFGALAPTPALSFSSPTTATRITIFSISD